MSIQQQDLIAYLETFISTNKREKIQQALALRTRYVTIVLEDLYHAQNINASLRSAECFGVQDVHIIEQEHSFSVNIGITKGASDWLDLHRYRQHHTNNTEHCFTALKSAGYRIVATSPTGKIQLHQVPLDQKIAFVFGTEETGLSKFALEAADMTVAIPMYGFTGSFNVSTSVALCLYDSITRLHATHYQWQMTDQEKNDLHLMWLRRLVRGSADIEARWHQENVSEK